MFGVNVFPLQTRTEIAGGHIEKEAIKSKVANFHLDPNFSDTYRFYPQKLNLYVNTHEVSQNFEKKNIL
jgi:hypothetical protein